MKKQTLIIVIVAILAVGAALAVGISIGKSQEKNSDQKQVSSTATSKSASTFTPPTAEEAKDPANMVGDNKTVLFYNNKLGPPDVTISKGQKVIWANLEDTAHQIVSDDTNAANFKSPVLSKGQSYQYVFKTAGTFKYHCALHPELKGTVTVK